MTDTEKTNEAPKGPSDSKAMLGNAKRSFVHLLLRFLRHHPGQVIDQGRRKYIVDNHGAWRRLGRDA
jgi:hypothetical protein